MQSTRTSLLVGAAPRCALPSLRHGVAPRQMFAAGVPSTRKQQSARTWGDSSVAPNAASSVEVEAEGNFVPVMPPDELPKGVRKEVRVQGKNVLIFWYRNEIYAIEARSPAEGAYSEGFIKSKFTQDYCIECPTTGSLFSLKDGSIVSWYPNNAVLRLLTPVDTCRKLEIYKVKLTQDAICVDVSSGGTVQGAANVTKGGSDTSLESNNVYGLEPKVEQGEDSKLAQAATQIVGTIAVLALLTVVIAVYKYVNQ